MTSTGQPPVDGRVVALAHYAARALLEGALARHGVTFEQSVALRVVAVAGGSLSREKLVAGVVGSLKADESAVRDVIEELAAARLVEEDPAEASRVRLTGSGREAHANTAAEGVEIAARLYAGIPAEELAVTGRVLRLVTERANAAAADVQAH
ncbi:MarR family transcriptional regulator [Streptomyces sp. NPDC048664]|uniref:MarR family transcriptional regulator n=1 Tax=Streptomyces sp. NPDC048664 TaxID=3154505 RepID=UPI00342966D9